MRVMAVVIVAALMAAWPADTATAAQKQPYDNQGRPLTSSAPQQILYFCYVHPSGEVYCNFRQQRDAPRHATGRR